MRRPVAGALDTVAAPMNLDFSQALLLLGALLACAAALSGWLRASVLSISVLAVAAGIALAAFDVVSVDPDLDLSSTSWSWR